MFRFFSRAEDGEDSMTTDQSTGNKVLQDTKVIWCNLKDS